MRMGAARPVAVALGQRARRPPRPARPRSGASSSDSFPWTSSRKCAVLVSRYFGKRVEQVERVLDPDVVGIARERGLQALAALLDGADAELVEAEHARARARSAGSSATACCGEGHRLGVEAVARAELGQAVVELRRCAGSGASALLARLLEARPCRPGGSARRPARRARAARRRCRARIASASRAAPSKSSCSSSSSARKTRASASFGFGLEARSDQLQHAGRAVEVLHARHGQQDARMRGLPAARASSSGVAASVAVVLLEEQLGQPDARVHVVGIGGDGLVEGLQRVLEELRDRRRRDSGRPCPPRPAPPTRGRSLWRCRRR